VWRYDRSTERPTKLFTGPALSPVPDPGDSLVAYLRWQPQEECTVQLFNANQNQHTELLAGSCLRITDWSADGQHLLLENSLAWLPDSLPNIRIWRYSFAEDSLYSFVVRDGDVRDGTLSPDGEWVAFSSDETGAPEVYVRRFGARDGGVRISRSGGRWPQWGDEGRELYFLSPKGEVLAADLIEALSGGAPVEPRVLFSDLMGQRVSFIDTGTGFGASPDGQAFFLRPRTEDPNIALVQNWPVLMNRR